MILYKFCQNRSWPIVNYEIETDKPRTTKCAAYIIQSDYLFFKQQEDLPGGLQIKKPYELDSNPCDS